MIKVFSLETLPNFIDNPVVKVFQADMFHGLAARDGKEDPHYPPVWAYTDAPSPLEISRTVHNVPDVCCPGGNLVVCQGLAERLRGVPNIRLQQVVFKRLVNIPWAKGDHSWVEALGDCDPLHFLRTMPDVPEFHRRIGAYYEVQTWRAQDLVERFEPCKDAIVQKDSPRKPRHITLRLSERMLREYPILWAEGLTLLADGAFQILDSSIDRDFFIVQEFVV